MRKRSIHRPSSRNKQSKTCLCMGLRIIHFCVLVALRTNVGVALAGIPLHYNVLPHAQYSQPLDPLTAPAFKAPIFVQKLSPFLFTNTDETKRGFSSKSGSKSTAGEVAGSSHERQQKVNYKAGRSDEQGIHAGENPTNVQVPALGLDVPRLSETKHVVPEVLSGEPMNPFFFTYTADVEGGFSSRTESGDGTGNVAGTYNVMLPDGRNRSIKYFAGADGFMADIQSNESGVEPHSNPANVKISSFSGAPVIPVRSSTGAGAVVIPAGFSTGAGAPVILARSSTGAGAAVIPAGFSTGAGAPVIPAGLSTGAGAPVLAAESSPFSFTYTADAIYRSGNEDIAGETVGSYPVTHADGIKRAVGYSIGPKSVRPRMQSNGKELGDNLAHASNSAFTGVIGSARAVIPISTAASPQSSFVPHPLATTGFFETTRYAPASESNYLWYR